MHKVIVSEGKIRAVPKDKIHIHLDRGCKLKIFIELSGVLTLVVDKKVDDFKARRLYYKLVQILNSNHEHVLDIEAELEILEEKVDDKPFG